MASKSLIRWRDAGRTPWTKLQTPMRWSAGRRGAGVMQRNRSTIRMWPSCIRIFKVSAGTSILNVSITSSQSPRRRFKDFFGSSSSGIEASTGVIRTRAKSVPISAGWGSISGQKCTAWMQNDRRRNWSKDWWSWRNGIAHQDFDPVAAGGAPTLHLARVTGWRRHRKRSGWPF